MRTLARPSTKLAARLDDRKPATHSGSTIPERTYRHGLRQLLEREFLYESLVDGVYFVNIRYMFNGDRLTFIRGYKLKKSSAQEEVTQGELAFGEVAALTAPNVAPEGS